jgi:hypothetical protein
MASIPFNHDFIFDQSRLQTDSIMASIPFNHDFIFDQSRLQTDSIMASIPFHHDFIPDQSSFQTDSIMASIPFNQVFRHGSIMTSNRFNYGFNPYQSRKLIPINQDQSLL